MPASHVDGSVFQEPQRVGIGDGLQRLSEGVNEIAVSAAEKAGRDDAMNFQRDADGNIQPAANQGSFILGPAGKEYQHSFNTSTFARMHGHVDEKVTELGQQYPHDVTGFKIAAGKYLDSLKDIGGALGPALFNYGTQVASQRAIGIMNAKFNADKANDYQAITTQMTDLETKIGNMARGVNSDVPDFLDDPSPRGIGESMRQLKGLYQSLVNPIYGGGAWTPEKVESKSRQFRQEAVNSWALGNVERIRDRDGPDPAVAWLKKNVMDSDTNMPEPERRATFDIGLALIARKSDDQKAKAKASAAGIAGVKKLFLDGTPPSEEVYEGVLQSAQDVHDAPGVAELRAAHDLYYKLRPYAQLAPRDGLAAVMGPPRSGARPFSAENLDSFLDQTKSIENPTGNPAAVSPTGARGDFQFTSATWARYGRGDINNKLDNRAAAGRLAIDNAASLKGALGRDPSEGEVYLAHQQGAGGAAALLAHPDENAVVALNKYAGLSLAEADRNIRVNGGNPTMTAGQFAAKWTSRFDGPVVAGRNSPVPFTREQVRENPFLAAVAAEQFANDIPRQIQVAKNDFELISKGIAMGAPPDVSRVAQVLQLAAAHPRELGDLGTKLRARVDAAPIAMMAAGMPDGGQSYIAAAEDLARESPDLYHMEVAHAMKEYVEGRHKALTEDPHAYAARSDVRWISSKPVPFQAMADPSSVGAENAGQVFSAAITQRRDAGFRIAQRLGTAPEAAMFTAQDVRALASGLQASDGMGADMILRGLQAQLHPQEMQALARNNDFSNAVAGMTRSGDPMKASAAYGFLDKQWRENPEAFKKDYGADMETKLAIWQKKIAFMSPEQAMREMQKANDPSTARAVEARRKEAEKFTKDYTPETITKHLFQSWGQWAFTRVGKDISPVSNDANASSAALYAEWCDHVSDLFAVSGDRGLAEAGALERIQMKWGLSEMNGGRVMAYPPERYYAPDINGSRKYVTDQLEDAIHDVSAKMGGAGVDPLKVRAAPRALVADQQTQEDIANRKAPSYRVVIQDDVGRWLPLESRPGTPLRFFADRDSVIAAQSERAAILRRQSQFVQGAM
jgi:hypothetical protein